MDDEVVGGEGVRWVGVIVTHFWEGLSADGYLWWL